MSNIQPVHMRQSGPIAGIPGGWFSGGQTVLVDFDTMTVVDQQPMQQPAYNASPLVAPSTEEPAQQVLASENDAFPDVVGVPDLSNETIASQEGAQ